MPITPPTHSPIHTHHFTRWQKILLLALLLCLLIYPSTPITVMAQTQSTRTQFGKMAKNSAQTAEAYVEEGQALLDTNDYERAIAAFTKALEVDSAFVEAYVGRGQAYWQMDELEKALADLNRAIKLTPEEATAYGLRGAIYNDLAEYPAAIEDFTQALTLAPNDSWTLAYRGYTFSLSEQFEAALTDLDQALKLNPSYVWAIVVRGTTYREMTEYTKALVDLTRAISLDPTYDWAFASRGSTYNLLGDYEKALADFDQALTLTPTYTWARQERGKIYQALGEYEKALADFDTILAENPTDDWTLAQRGWLYFDTERYEAALEDFSAAIAVDPQYDWALAKRGQTYQAMEEYDAALADFTAAIAIDPTYGWYYALRADLLRIMERYDEALADANQAVELTPDDEFAWGVRGYVYRMAEQYEDAVADFTQAITLEPTYGWAYTMRGELYQLLARDDEALADFEEANRLNGVVAGNSLTSTATSEAVESTTTESTTTESTTLDESPQITANDTEAVQSLAAAEGAVIQIEAVGTFSSPTEEGSSVQAGSGSGFIIDPSGIAVTNNHVVTGGALFKVYVEGQEKALNARVLGVSECADLAVIDIEGEGFPYLSWYDGDIHVGLDIYAAGYPLGDPEYTLTRGIIAKARANGQTAWSSLDQVLQHDADINPGNSGGPLLTDQGQVVGINYAVNAQFRQSFAIGRAEALPIIEQLRQGQDVDALGINGTAYSDGADLHGIWVSSVQSGSPADGAGVQGGDFILSLENIAMAGDGTMQAYCEVVRSHGTGDTLNLELFRPSTSELCTGQINGRALTCQTIELSSAAVAAGTSAVEKNSPPATPDTAQPIEWQSVTHESGRFLLSIPTAWTVHESTTTDDRQQLTVKSETDNSAAVFSLYSTSSDRQNFDSALDEIRTGLEKDAAELLTTCTYDGRNTFTNSHFQGAFEHWTLCGPEQQQLFTVAMWPLDQEAYHLYAIILWNPTWAAAALDQMLDSLKVNDQATAVVESNILNVRNGPGTTYGAMGQLQRGARLPVIAQAYNCTWLQVQLPDGKQGWIAGQAPYAALDGNCAEIPQGKIPPAPAGGGTGGNGCILFQNHFNDEANVTLTSKDGKYNKTFKVGRKANHRECVAPGGYTYTIDVPPPWGSINGELDIQRGRTITFPIYGN